MDFFDMMTGPGAWGMWMLYAAVAGTWIVVVGLVVWAIRTVGRSRMEDEHQTAIALLERRYAEGEMAEAEFRRMRQTLAEPAPAVRVLGDPALHLVTQTRAAREITDLDWGPRPVA